VFSDSKRVSEILIHRNKCLHTCALLKEERAVDSYEYFSYCYYFRKSIGINEYWIGLCKKIGWMTATYWLDGSTSKFRPWASGEPNENTTCIRIDLSAMKDKDCSERYNYICKISQGTHVASLQPQLTL